MMKIYKEINLRPEVIAYIKECLAEGHTLAKYLLQRDDLDSGRVITFIPQEIDVRDEEVNNPKYGRLFPEPPPETHIKIPGGKMVLIPNTDTILMQIIQKFLSTGEGRVCVLEDALARPHDPSLSSADTRIVIFNSEVYHVLLSSDAEDNELILQTIRRASSWLFIGAMTSILREGDFFLEAGKITSEKLKVLAERIEKIVVGAYDGEGYLIWERK